MKFAQESEFVLSLPTIETTQIFFQDQIFVHCSHGAENVELRYSTDGSEPTESSALYQDPVSIDQSLIFKISAFHPKLSSSESISTQFMRVDNQTPVKQVILDRPPHEFYSGSGPEGIADRKKGGRNFRDSEWMGFDGGTIELILEFEHKYKFSKVTSSLFGDVDSWVFLPQRIDVLYSKNGRIYKKWNSLNWTQSQESLSKDFYFLTVQGKHKKAKYVKILIQSMDEIPEWHQGKGTKPWLFIDEIIVE